LDKEEYVSPVREILAEETPISLPAIAVELPALNKAIEDYLANIPLRIKQEMAQYLNHSDNDPHPGMSPHVRQVHDATVGLVNIIKSHAEENDQIKEIAKKILE
jgi:hypothetical protein